MKKTVKKYQKGGGIEDPKESKNASTIKSPSQALGSMSGKDYRQLKKGVKREQKLARIESGQQGDRVDNVIKAVASGAEAASSAANAVRSTREAVGKMKKGGAMKKYKTGGMVNSNLKVSALKTAGSKGVKSGVNPKAAASKVAKGRVGGTSSAPKTAVPKAKYGMSMRKK
jgi:hypothetical protein